MPGCHGAHESHQVQDRLRAVHPQLAEPPWQDGKQDPQPPPSLPRCATPAPAAAVPPFTEHGPRFSAGSPDVLIKPVFVIWALQTCAVLQDNLSPWEEGECPRQPPPPRTSGHGGGGSHRWAEGLGACPEQQTNSHPPGAALTLNYLPNYLYGDRGNGNKPSAWDGSLATRRLSC